VPVGRISPVSRRSARPRRPRGRALAPRSRPAEQPPKHLSRRQDVPALQHVQQEQRDQAVCARVEGATFGSRAASGLGLAGIQARTSRLRRERISNIAVDSPLTCAKYKAQSGVSNPAAPCECSIEEANRSEAGSA
jgi:hypothetical protein